jgi:alpha-tubulin suppressor-like RCC1 family protein
MFSWGAGNYGALGFGSRQDIQFPRELKIINSDIKITKVVCGRLHSMCKTTREWVYSWGCGLNGRLGHGDSEDILEPKEIQLLTNAKVIDFSAGESHSAAISRNQKLFTWGNGVYGRLGHGFDSTETKPRIVEDLQENVI